MTERLQRLERADSRTWTMVAVDAESPGAAQIETGCEEAIARGDDDWVVVEDKSSSVLYCNIEVLVVDDPRVEFVEMVRWRFPESFASAEERNI